METKDFYVIRHGYDDHSYIDINNDPPLIEKGILMARDMSRDMVDILKKRSVDSGVSLRTSSKKRASETASIIADSLDRAKIDYEFVVDPNLRELQQGKVINFNNLSHEQRVRSLEVAWKAFDDKRVAGDADYHFGSPAINECGEPVLEDFMETPYGESQNEFSERMRVALLDILKITDAGRVPIAVTHRGGIREIVNTTYALNNGLPVSQSRVLEMSGLKYCEIINIEVADTQLCLVALKNLLENTAEIKQ